MKTKSEHPINYIIDSEFHGLTKKEYFAALAMQAIISSPNSVDTFLELEKKPTDMTYSQCVAEYAVIQAENLIKVLNSKE